MVSFWVIVGILWGLWIAYTVFRYREYLKSVFRVSFEQGKKGFRDKKR